MKLGNIFTRYLTQEVGIYLKFNIVNLITNNHQVDITSIRFIRLYY